MAELPRILLHNAETEPLGQALLRRFPNADFRACQTYEGLPAMVADFRPQVVYTVRFAGTPTFPRDALFGTDAVRWVANGGAGTDHFGKWDPTRTTVTNAAGVAASMMAEYVIGGFLHFTLDVPGLQSDKTSRTWNAARQVRPLAGRVLLIVGLGNTGRAIARRAKAFGLRVVGTRAQPKEMEHVDEVHGAAALPELLPQADFVSIATPLLPATRGMIGAAEIAAMKPGVILADVSRGGVVDQTALCAALENGHVAGAALDVFKTEPLPDTDPLWDADNVIISPHCSSVYDGWEEASFDLFLDNLARWVDGRPLINVVDPKRGY